MSCGVGHRHSSDQGSDPELLWLWHRPVATAPIRPLAWEPPYATGAALEKAKRQKKKKKKNSVICYIMDEDITPSEISQSQKDKHCTIPLIYAI